MMTRNVYTQPDLMLNGYFSSKIDEMPGQRWERASGELFSRAVVLVLPSVGRVGCCYGNRPNYERPVHENQLL